MQTHTQRLSQTFVGRVKLPLKLILQVQKLYQTLPVSSIPLKLLQRLWMSHAHLIVLVLYQAKPGENHFILLWCYYLSYSPRLWFWQHRAILYIWIITPSLMKHLTSPLAIVLAAKRPCLSALEEPGNRAVIILGGSLWGRLWFSGDRTQKKKKKKNHPEKKKKHLKGWNHSAMALSKAEI